MTVSIYTLINDSVANMGAVNPKVKDLAIEIIKRAYHEGIYVKFTSGYRSNAQQQKLYNQGRTTPGNIVTNAKPGQSIHNYGLALDFVLVSEDGRRAIWSVTKEWRRVAAIGKELGFQWGGDWTRFVDYPHLDMQRGISLSQLAAGKRPSVPDVPKRSYIGAGDSGDEVVSLQKYLNKIGIKVTVDGDYGPATIEAVKQFQSKNGLVADGVYGSGSKAKMNELLKADNAVVASKPKPIEKETETVEQYRAVSKSFVEDWAWAKENGILDGSKPGESITREQISAVAHRLDIKWQKELDALRAELKK